MVYYATINMRILIMAKATKWDYSKIKNFPEGGTIQRSGTGLIVIRRKTVYDPRIGRGRDASREYLGKLFKTPISERWGKQICLNE